MGDSVAPPYYRRGIFVMCSFRFFSCYHGEDTTPYGQTYDRDLFRESLEPNDRGGGIESRFTLEDDDLDDEDDY